MKNEHPTAKNFQLYNAATGSVIERGFETAQDARDRIPYWKGELSMVYESSKINFAPNVRPETQKGRVSPLARKK